MKRLLLVCLVAVLSFSAFAVNAQVATPELTALAQYLPADTLLAAAIRTDEAFIDTLDGLIAPIAEISPDLADDFSLRAGLDMTFADAEFDATYANDIRPWLGDSAMIGVLPTLDLSGDLEFAYPDNITGDDDGVFIVLAVKDRAALEAFFEKLAQTEGASLGDLPSEQQGRFTVYTVEETVIALGEDALIIANANGVWSTTNIPAGDFATLANSEDFKGALDRLPNEAGYNALGYFNMPLYRSYIEVLANQAGESARTEAQSTLVGIRGLSSISAGLVILNGRSLTADFAGDIGDLNFGGGTINPAFTNSIPDAPFVVQLNNVYELVADFFGYVGSVSTEGELEEFEQGLEDIDTGVRAIAGRDPQTLFGWMTRDLALTLGLSSTAATNTLGANPLDLALLIDASADPASALELVNVFDELLKAERIDALTEGAIAAEVSRNGNTLSFKLTNNDIPFPVDIKVGLENDVFFISTPNYAPGVAAALDQSANFSAAGIGQLPQASSVYYIDFDQLRALPDILLSLGGSTPSDIEDLRSLLNLFESATLSTATNDGGNLLRAVITLAE